ncbi:hypothetical protein I9018_18255 [Pseudomonas sp. MPFS]|uniref:hypothetical protein n=1 Tax=Pseudomonas sp. MPFS TaxID=2795724 RepID=UPI001F13A35C|nr:hypothetical protein [Pseudomonas sp. MPFS]UMZ09481.1 hypothetical protein I9018_18255 [Pseudomonas sp. MPFS]
MFVHGVEYKFYCASSVVEGHDGLGFECWEGDSRVLFEIFRNDETLRYEVTLFEQDIPLELLEYAVPIARQQLGDFVANA